MPCYLKKPLFAQSRGFTLIELLTVIAIVGVLAAIIIPVVGKVRQSARQTQCSSNLRQIGIALNLAAVEGKDRYPPGNTGTLLDAQGSIIGTNTGYGFFVGEFLGTSGAKATNASRVMVDPLTENADIIGTASMSTVGTTYSANPRVLGVASTATINLSQIARSPNSPGVQRNAVRRASRVALVGTGVTQDGANWGAYNTYSRPATLYGSNVDEVLAPETGNTSGTGGTLGGIAYRANGGRSAMFVMVDGSVRIIPKGEVTVGLFAADL